MFVVVVLIGMKLVTQVSRCPEQSLIQQLSSDTADDLWVANSQFKPASLAEAHARRVTHPAPFPTKKL